MRTITQEMEKAYYSQTIYYLGELVKLTCHPGDGKRICLLNL
jgi:hypothetical protein